MHAYLLVTARLREAGHVDAAAKRLRPVQDVAILGAGPYDVLLDVRARNFAELARTVARVQHLRGVTRAVACTISQTTRREP